MKNSISKVMDAKDIAVNNLIGKNGIFGVGIGRSNRKKENDQGLVIQIFVDKDSDKFKLNQMEKVPKSINEVPIETNVTSAYAFLGSSLDNQILSYEGNLGTDTGDEGMYRPLVSGAQIGHIPNGDKDVTINLGTLGMFVKDKNNEDVYILSNYHVLTSQGTKIYQPVPVQSVTTELFVGETLKGDFYPSCDAAIAKIRPDLSYDYSRVLGLGKINGIDTTSQSSWLKNTVKKRGRSSFVTRGTILAVEVTLILPEILNSNQTMDHIFLVGGDLDTPFSTVGDSGSLVLTNYPNKTNNNKVLGLLFAEFENEKKERITCCCDINRVFEALDIEEISG
jgi:hypothetical protein